MLACVKDMITGKYVQVHGADCRECVCVHACTIRNCIEQPRDGVAVTGMQGSQDSQGMYFVSM